MVLAQTRSAFFEGYNFNYRPRSSLYGEFLRLAESRGWRYPSKRGTFEKAWNACFGPEVPVGQDVDNTKDELVVEQDDVLAVLSQFEELDLEGRLTRRERMLRQVGEEFAGYYGSEEGRLRQWQILCQDCGVGGRPQSIKKCKKV